MNGDGTMARVPDLIGYCTEHGLKMITVADIVAHRHRTEQLVERIAVASLPTAFGEFVAYGYRSMIDGQQHVALVMGDVDGPSDVLVRVHSECLTGDVFHSLRCDCGEQLERALAQIAAEGGGVLLYLSQEGRGIGLSEQAARLRAAGAGARHRGCEPGPGAARSTRATTARVPDPGRSRPDHRCG